MTDCRQFAIILPAGPISIPTRISKVRLRKSGTMVGRITVNDSNVVLDSSSNGTVRLASNGTSRVEVAGGGLRPVTDNAYDLGSSSQRFAQAYISDGIFFGSETSDHLGTYEEGTWNPAYATSNGDGTFAHDIQVGYYRKIRRFVFLSFRIRTDSIGSPSGNIQITGLPFPAANVSTQNTGGTLMVGRTIAFTSFLLAVMSSTMEVLSLYAKRQPQQAGER